MAETQHLLEANTNPQLLRRRRAGNDGGGGILCGASALSGTGISVPEFMEKWRLVLRSMIAIWIGACGVVSLQFMIGYKMRCYYACRTCDYSDSDDYYGPYSYCGHGMLYFSPIVLLITSIIYWVYWIFAFKGKITGIIDVVINIVCLVLVVVGWACAISYYGGYAGAFIGGYAFVGMIVYIVLHFVFPAK